MDRFVAMIWNPEDQSRHLQVAAWSQALQYQSPRWNRVLDLPGLRVFSFEHRDNGPVVTRWSNGEGVVLGVLFRRGRETEGRVRTLEHADSERVSATNGDLLAKAYWGNYVAIWHNPSTESVMVLRDPCGATPCYTRHIDGITLAFADIEDVTVFRGLRFSVDWNYLQAFILFNYFVTRHTGLAEAKELLGGQRLELRRSGEPLLSWAWNGAAIAAAAEPRSFEDASAELRATAESCFSAWGSEYRSIIVSLSGGLDSSILVNLLQREGSADICAQHWLFGGYEQYESVMARSAAAYAGVTLFESPMDPAKDDARRILSMRRRARPKLQTRAVLIDDVSRELADSIGADCFMTGQGGDSVFLQYGGAQRILADYVRLRGLGPDVTRIAYTTAMLQRSSVWHVLRDVLVQPRWRPLEYVYDPDRNRHTPLTSTAIDAISDDYKYHPWYEEAKRLPPCKADQLTSIVALYNYHSDYGRGIDRDVILPYFSQPIVELVLRTPTFLLAHNGIDRALERHAFSDLIPQAIARRTGKGGISHYVRDVWRRNQNFYRELILDGELMKQGWLQRQKIERMLSAEYAADGRGGTFVGLLAVAEAWLKSWRSMTPPPTTEAAQNIFT
ncbi:MAG TPA: asparagine synthase-related protein [Vitreimonas sp.]|uniref:asparagine synthase-related protein n=1 Tax=Vitreimonas sp. TaxID=3069702 RepID=UPI002D6D68A2|nr:asparagine synthase-related protein [Vitreimonas sp.]HYD86045.1 asparagine synthase-related protein [Vitreimonas sp.]